MAKGKKTGGRVKGTPNKSTKTMREAAADLLENYQSSGLMFEDFKAIEPKDRLLIAEKLMQYTVPKLQAVALSTDADKQLTIEERLIELSQDPNDA